MKRLRLPLLKPFAETQRLYLLHGGAPLKNLIRNGSFEEAIRKFQRPRTP